MSKFENKLVAILNKSLEPGVAMNALAHMCIGFGAHLGRERLRLTDYQDGDGNEHPFISEMPFMILRETGGKIRSICKMAKEMGIHCVDFVDTMTIGTFHEQLEKTKEKKEEELIYYGIVLFGDWDKVTELTRKCSLWR